LRASPGDAETSRYSYGRAHGSLNVARLISARLTGSLSFIIWNVEISDEMFAMSAIARRDLGSLGDVCVEEKGNRREGGDERQDHEQFDQREATAVPRPSHDQAAQPAMSGRGHGVD
jgi:hypothetical protein